MTKIEICIAILSCGIGLDMDDMDVRYLFM